MNWVTDELSHAIKMFEILLRSNFFSQLQYSWIFDKAKFSVTAGPLTIWSKHILIPSTSNYILTIEFIYLKYDPRTLRSRKLNF